VSLALAAHASDATYLDVPPIINITHKSILSSECQNILYGDVEQEDMREAYDGG
jgi:hypothetical protein